MSPFQVCFTIVYLTYVVVALHHIFFKKDKSQVSIEDIEKDKLVCDVLRWCITNIQPVVKRKSRPVYKIDGSTRGSILGSYEYNKKLITIYPNKHNSIESLVDTCIHEYVHHLQIRNLRDNKRYRKLTNKTSYWENDLEVEARSIATKFRSKCMKDLNLVR